MHLDRRLLGWGLFFILLGAIPLAVRANLLDGSVVDQWPLLWPVILIGWGVGLILRNTPMSWVGGAVAVTALGIMGGSAIATGFHGIPVAGGCTDNGSGSGFQSRSGQLQASARMTIEFNCGTLNVAGGEGSGWSVSGSDRVGRGPDISETSDGVSIRAERNMNIFSDVGRATWDVTVPRTPAIDLSVTLNAGEGHLSFTGAEANLRTMSLTLNAGALDADMTASKLTSVNATVNAGSAGLTLPGNVNTMNVTVNAGGVKVCLPEGTMVRVQWNGGLGSNNFAAAGLVRQDEHTWLSAGFATTGAHTELNASANAGSFDLRFGGICGA